MKRGKDEDKSMGPMFPRLHVNDTEKGGPRAPPRNKMALYEQLSIPSQRLSGEVLPFNLNSTANYAPPPSSSSQGGVSERGLPFPLQQPPNKTNNRYSDLNNQLVQQEHKKKQEEDDFRVPIFFKQSGTNLDRSGNHQNEDNEGFSGRVTNVQKASERNKLTDGNVLIRLQGNVMLRDHVVDSQADNNAIKDTEQEVARSPNDPTNGDSVSETSMVDSICGVDISPDDVVGIIGQKHFWKARRAIVNQQRVFAVQVFELHRLIKVQRLIAGSPQLMMLEDDAFLGKVPPIKKIPLQYANVPKLTDKPNENITEFSAENAPPSSSIRNTFSGFPLPPMGSWNLNQPTGHQWLIPVMSPSEGLVYKPYPGPGYMGPGPGLGLGPAPGPGPGPGPPSSNFVNYAGLVAAPPPPPPRPSYQWPTGFRPLVPPTHGYFPSYGMQTVNQYEGSGNVPIVGKFNGCSSNEREVQASPSDKALPLFPTCPPAEGRLGLGLGPGPQPSRVIRVIPRSARTATETVARIFESIQEERKQHDSD